VVRQWDLVQDIVLPEQYAPSYYWQPRNILLMPIVRKLDYWIIRELILEARLGTHFYYYSRHVIRFFSKSHIQN
jgi:hypothetical protein